MTAAVASCPLSLQPLTTPRHAWLRFVLPLLVVSLLIGLLGLVGYRYLSEEIRRETHRTLAVIAEQKRQQVEHWVDQTRIDAELYFHAHAQLPLLLSQWLEGGRQDASLVERMRVRMSELARERGWGGVSVLDTEGRLVFTVGEAALSPGDGAIQDIVARPRIETHDLHRDPTGRPAYGRLAPIGLPDAPSIGVAYLSWSADTNLYPLVESWPVPTRTAETYLVRRDGSRVRFLTPLRHHPDAALVLGHPLDSSQLPAARAALGERGILNGGRDYRGAPVLAYASAVAGTPWLMIAEIDEREAYASVRTAAWTTALVMGLGLLLLYSASYQIWHRDRQRRELATLQAQRAAESRFRVVFEQAPLGIALRDSLTGRIIETNQRFAEIVGRPCAAMIGLDPIALTHPDDIRASLDYTDRLKRGEIAGYRQHKRYLRPSGDIVWASLTCAPVQVEREGAPRYLTIVEDITERRQMEERLRQAMAAAESANAAKSEFLAHMSHEIRTPLNAVLGLAQSLAREPLAEHQRDMVERIRTAGQALLAILDDVLDLSKIEAGQLRIEPRPFELGELLANLDSLMGRAARAKGLTLSIQGPVPPVGTLSGDGLRLEQVLLNLLGNAIKFTEPSAGGGSIRLRVRAEHADTEPLRLRFEISDTGIGIAPEAQARLFTPFTQADAGISRRFGGTGLGLSICKRLVELMGGTIGVVSALGRGSTFWLELAFERAEPQIPVSKDTETPLGIPGSRLAGAHLLAVDDSAMSRDLIERALALEGATVTLAADGQQALQILSTRPECFDGVLMDVQMPVMDGLTATRAIREGLGLTTLPIIAFTAGVREEQRDAARAAGVNDVLPKPLDLEQMTAVLARWIEPKPDRRVEQPPPTPASTPEHADIDSAFPAIPGIDSACAAQRLGHDRAMFIGLLRLFVEDFADAAERTRQDLDAGEHASAARRMHTLRGNAGFLCALDLVARATAMEQAIERGETDLQPTLADLERGLAALVEASTPWRTP